MRLNEPNNRANTNIVNTLLGEESRYGGSKSSLDYKEQNNGVLTTAKTAKKKTDQKNQSNQEEKEPQQPEQEESERKNERKSSFPTRARERTGIPPRRYDLSDLAKMDEYDLMNALREDPEFAAAVQEYSAQLDEKEKAEKAAEEERKDRRSKPSSAPVAERRKARLAKSAPSSSSSSSSEPVAAPTIRPGSEIYPNHVRDLMDSGVPVTQWIVLLLLVGAGLYFLMGPELKEGLGYIMKQTGKTKKPSRKGNNNKNNRKSKLRSRQNNKGKKQMDAPRKVSAVKKTPAISKSKPEPVKLETPKAERQQETAEETLTKLSVVEKPKKKRNKKKKETKTQAKESLNVASTENGSTDHSETEETPSLSFPPGISTPLIFMESDDTDAGEWETVTKSRKPVAKSPPAKPVAEEAPKATAKTTNIVAPQLPVDKAKTTTPTVDIQQKVEAAQAASAEQEIYSLQAASAEPESTGDGWATVTKARKPKVATPATTKSATAPDTESKPAEQAAKTEDKKKQEAEALDDKKVKTKTSKNKKQTPSQPAKSENGSSTDGDAALALKLQLEEENRANHETSGQAEEQWEEVKKNKTKKGQKATTS
ncbi:MAG: hypothetical protein SGBAC_004302 [Bacillariaceae sp.]